jgi:hypothetical protein
LRSQQRPQLFKDSRNRVVVPLKITGRIANPNVNLDTRSFAQKGMAARWKKYRLPAR